jgi:metal-sulfur cluster biosynthetic enzyme
MSNEKILELLKDVVYTELGINIVYLGQIYDLKEEDGNLIMTMILI